MRPAAALATFALILGGCANSSLGTGGIPTCDTAGDLRSVTLLQFQAVPEATWGPCIETLQADWDYRAQVAKQGEARFWLESQDLGFPFLEVTLTPACDPGDAERVPHPVEGVERFIDVRDRAQVPRVVIVPVAARHRQRAREIAAAVPGLGGLEGSVVPEVDDGDDLPSLRIEAALARGHAVIVIDDREVADGTVEMILPGGEARIGTSVTSALEHALDARPEPVYVATWYERFEGGCITYRFNAHGERAASVAREVDRALGLFPLATVRAVLADELGYDVAVD